MLLLHVCDSCQRLNDGNDKRREVRSKEKRATRMQLQTFKVITLVTEIPTAPSDVDIHLEPNIQGGLEEMKICVPKLNKAYQYTNLTLNVAMWIQVLTYGSNTAAMELLPKPVPSD